MATDFSGLNNFMRRLDKAKRLENSRDNISSAVADKGVEVAKSAYTVSGISRADVFKEKAGIGEYDVIAQGEGLSFDEYGTGFYADGTYKGKLPTQPITFESAGETRTTQGWDYYYDNPDTKVEIDGKKGWMLGSNFMTGNTAGNQMYNTSIELGEQAPEVVKEIVKDLLK